MNADNTWEATDLSEFSFMLSPMQWVFDGDENQVFRALELNDGRYLISWQNADGFHAECFFSIGDVLMEVAEKNWVILPSTSQ